MSKKEEKKLKILIVDDEEDLRWILSKILRDEGYSVVSAQDAQEAIARVKESRFAIAFIDIVLPGKNGVEVYKAIKKISPTTVAVIMTGHPGEEPLVKKAIKGGAFCCLFKPFTIEKILNVVKKIKGEKD